MPELNDDDDTCLSRFVNGARVCLLGNILTVEDAFLPESDAIALNEQRLKTSFKQFYVIQIKIIYSLQTPLFKKFT